MIKINLSPNKKSIAITNVGGFDFTKIKIKALLLVIVLIYLPDFLLIPMWQKDLEDANTSVAAKQTELSELKRKISQSLDLERQIKELKAQEENLIKKLSAVKEAISLKKNPASILLYIAKNIPADLWIDEIRIQNENMSIIGFAQSYVSVGNFVNSLKSSVFIQSANIRETKQEGRLQSFSVDFTISRFDQ